MQRRQKPDAKDWRSYNRAMRDKLRRAWPIAKAFLWLLILIMIGRQFARDLHRPELRQRSLHMGWLVLSGLLYLLGLSLSALYWDRLLGHLGSRPPLGAALRAYYIGHLGKYLPGKAWALLLRTNMVRGYGVSAGLAALTSFYEVLTTMAAGVLVAAVLFAVLGADAGAGLNADTLRRLMVLEQPVEGGLQRPVVVLLSLLLFFAIAVPLQPAIFNRLAHRLSLPFRERDAAQLPRIRLAYLLEGLAFTAVGWLLLGASFAAALRGVVGEGWPLLDVRTARLPAIMGLAYVIGFVVLIAPGGLGVREFMLTLLLTPELVGVQDMDQEQARATVVLAVLVLRLVWTASELLAALVCRLFPCSRDAQRSA
ncbi:MAG TPA: lysylphosphatidylglycerol synthase domain-containing protein [Gemmataceae bacterium]|nr:lysylphosphatidylglycerol synthase domain-containing protein [Gemmataceae bacterium]